MLEIGLAACRRGKNLPGIQVFYNLASHPCVENLTSEYFSQHFFHLIFFLDIIELLWNLVQQNFNAIKNFPCEKVLANNTASTFQMKNVLHCKTMDDLQYHKGVLSVVQNYPHIKEVYPLTLITLSNNEMTIILTG